MSSKNWFVQVSVIALLAACQAAHAAEWVKGKVVDGGLNDPKNGVAAVKVEIKELDTGKALAQGITDALGQYAIEIDAANKNELVAYFSKIGYMKRPTSHRVLKINNQPNVVLSLETAAREYYKGMAGNILTAHATGSDTTKAFYSAVTALPAADKAIVLDEIKLKSSSVWSEFDRADKSFLTSQKLIAQIRVANLPSKDQSVFVYPNFESTGTVSVYGEVNSDKDKKTTEDIIKGFDGAGQVKSNLIIRRNASANLR